MCRRKVRCRSKVSIILIVATAAAGLPVLGSPAAGSDLDELKREAQELTEELRRELDAVRAERERLEAERKALEVEHADASPTTRPDAEETQRRVSILAREIERLKENIVLPEIKEYKSLYGLGPAASKVYQVDRGLSIGGYGEANYSETVSNADADHDEADFVRFVLYTGYKFSDRILWNAEIELEHATTDKDGSVSLELGYLDFLASEGLNARAGIVLVPLGFINEIHEPLFFHGNNRPQVERSIIPSTWREIGAGVFGSLHEDLEYRAYLTTNLDAKGFSASGIRGGRQKGSKARAENLAASLRLDYSPHQLPGLLIGGSALLGNTGQDQEFDGRRADAFLTLWAAHAQYRYRGLEMRGLAAFGTLEDVEVLSRDLGETIADRFGGWYAEIAYDIMPYLFPDKSQQYLAPFFRYEELDTQASVGRGFARDPTKDVEVYTIGASYKPHPQVVIKLDYRNFELRAGSPTDDINLGIGFIF